MITTIKLDATKMNSEDRKKKMAQVAQEMHTVINSSIFRDQILKLKPFDGERSKYKNLSNMEVYKMIIHGADIHEPQMDYELDIFVDDYYTWKKVIGYTKPRVDRIIRVNTKYFDKRHTVDIGSNILHEYGHLMGFGHDFFYNDERPSSICYQFNKAYENAYKKLFNLQTAPVRVCSRPWKYLKLRKVCRWEERLVK
tara:strand:- start:902 stop:1492 length:591 start_codon:yes stop_codon:yes gene_type:complete